MLVKYLDPSLISAIHSLNSSHGVEQSNLFILNLFWYPTVSFRDGPADVSQSLLPTTKTPLNNKRRAIYFSYFFTAGFGIIFGFLVLCFPASLLFCFLLSLLLCLSASLLYLLLFFSASLLSLLLCSSAFVLYLLLFFSASLLSLLLCFSAFVLLCLSTSTILLFLFFRQVFLLLYILPAPLLLCFLSLLPLCFFFSFALLSPVCKHPRWNPKKP